MKARLVLPLVLAVAACGESQPSKFYVLNAQTFPEHASRAGATTVALGAINLPPALDRPQIARRRGANEIDYAEDERWAGALDEMVRRVLANDLAGQLPAGMTLVDNATATPAALTVALDVSRFDADESGKTVLEVRWEILGRDGPTGAARQATIEEPGSGKAAAAIAASMSRALARLAADIARGLPRRA